MVTRLRNMSFEEHKRPINLILLKCWKNVRHRSPKMVSRTAEYVIRRTFPTYHPSITHVLEKHTTAACVLWRSFAPSHTSISHLLKQTWKSGFNPKLYPRAFFMAFFLPLFPFQYNKCRIHSNEFVKQHYTTRERRNVFSHIVNNLQNQLSEYLLKQ